MLRRPFGQEGVLFSNLYLKRPCSLSLFFFLFFPSVLRGGGGLDKSSWRGYKPFAINRGGLETDEKEWVELNSLSSCISSFAKIC